MTTLYFVIISFVMALLPMLIAFLREKAKGNNNTPDWVPPLKVGAWIFGGLVAIYLIIIKGVLAKHLVDYWWFAYNGVPERWITEKSMSVVLWLIGFTVSALVFSIVTAISSRGMTFVPPETPVRRRGAANDETTFQNAAQEWDSYMFWWKLGAFIVITVTSIIFAGIMSSFRFDFQQGLWGQPSGVNDPVKSLDVIQFFDFRLTMIKDMFWWTFALVFVASLFAIGSIRYNSQKTGVYEKHTNGRFENAGTWYFTRGLNVVKSWAALMLVFAAANSWMQQFNMLIQGNSEAVGGSAGYTDVMFRIPNYTVLAWILGISALIILVFQIRDEISKRSVILLSSALAVPLLYWILVIGVGSYFYQVKVEQSGMKLEETYINHKLAMTKWAYVLDKTQYVTNMQFVDSLTPEELAANDDVLSQGRVLDYTLLLDQTKALEAYNFYKFGDFDVLNCQGKVCMGSVREFNVSELPTNIDPWVRDHLRFTHGYGHVVVDSSTVKTDGTPLYIVQNKPPEGPESLLVKENGTYFGEYTKEYAIIKTAVAEYDYPVGETFADSSYNGPAGVPLNSFWRRFLFAVRFEEPKILLSPLLTKDSRIIYYHSLGEIVYRLLPESVYCDGDPYWMPGGTEKLWIIHCYSRSNKVPYAERLNAIDAELSDNNYFRMSYTVTIGAYSGDWKIYRMATDDPIAATWQSIYPELFTPLSEMPAEIRALLRWPDSFKIAQDTIFRIHHDIDAAGYYTREQSQWDRVKERDNFNGVLQYAAPRFVQMRLPNQPNIEYISTSYFTSKNNKPLIAGLYARNTPEHYGELVAIKSPANVSVLGHEQVDSKVQDDIGEWITLNSTEGKAANNGDNVLVPVYGNNNRISFVFVKGIFLNVDGQIKLEYVFVINGSEIRKSGPTLKTALAQLYSGTTGTWQELSAQAYQHYMKAQECYGAGDWVCFETEQSAFENALKSLELLRQKEDQ